MQQNIFVLFAHSATLIYSRVSGLLKLSDWQFLSLFIFTISMSLREHTELKAWFQVFLCISRCQEQHYAVFTLELISLPFQYANISLNSGDQHHNYRSFYDVTIVLYLKYQHGCYFKHKLLICLQKQTSGLKIQIRLHAALWFQSHGRGARRKGRFKGSDGSTSSDTTTNSLVRQVRL